MITATDAAGNTKTTTRRITHQGARRLTGRHQGSGAAASIAAAPALPLPPYPGGMLRSVLLLAVVLVVPATAEAKATTITCDAGQYQLLHGENPRIAKLRAHNLPRKTSGYAPRCLVAEAIAADIQRALQDGERAPRALTCTARAGARDAGAAATRTAAPTATARASRGGE